MLSRLLPREVEFFRFFRESSEALANSSHEFLELVKSPAANVGLVEKISHWEQAADKVTHEALTLLHETFITPLDRGDIYALIMRLDDIHDCLNAAAQRVRMFEMQRLPEEVIGSAEIVVRMSRTIQGMMGRLDNLKKPDQLLMEARSLHRMESEADRLHQAGLARLFKDESDWKQLLKTKEIMDFLEDALDRCADLGTIVEGVVLEYA